MMGGDATLPKLLWDFLLTIWMWVTSPLSRAGLIRLEKQGWVFYGLCMVRHASWGWDPREATQGELQGELRHAPMTCILQELW